MYMSADLQRAALVKAARVIDNKIAYRDGLIEKYRKEIDALLGERQGLLDEYNALGDDEGADE
jgi:hypothetical protein